MIAGDPGSLGERLDEFFEECILPAEPAFLADAVTAGPGDRPTVMDDLRARGPSTRTLEPAPSHRRQREPTRPAHTRAARRADRP